MAKKESPEKIVENPITANCVYASANLREDLNNKVLKGCMSSPEFKFKGKIYYDSTGLYCKLAKDKNPADFNDYCPNKTGCTYKNGETIKVKL